MLHLNITFDRYASI